MGPCCDLTYAKYINPDGTLDLDALAAAVKQCEANGRSADKKITACTCECHRKGQRVLH